MDKVVDLDTAVAHVRPGDAVHVMCGHTRWTAAARQLVRRVVGPRPRLHARHAEPVVARHAVLPGRARAQGRHRLLGRRLPQLHPQPDLLRRLPSRRGRGRALVVPGLPAAAGGRRPGAAGRHHRARSPARRWRTTTASPWSTRRSATVGLVEALRPRRRAGARARSPTATATWPSTRRCSKGCGARWPPARRDRHRRAGGRRHPAVVPPGAPSRRTGCCRSPSARWARTPAACTAGSPRPSPTARTSSSGPRSATPVAARRLRRLDPRLGARRPDHAGVPGPARRRARRPAAPTVRPRLVARRRGAPTRPTSTPRERLGARRGVRRPGAGRPDRRHRRRRRARRRRRRQPRHLAGGRHGPHRGSACVLTAELGLWGYEPTPADPFVFNHRAFPSATMLADSSEVLGHGHAGSRAPRSLACLGAAIVDVDGNIDSTVIPGKAFLVGSGGGNDVASAADEVVVIHAHPRRTVRGAVRHLTRRSGRTLCRTWASSRRARMGRSSSPRCPAGATRWRSE